MRTTTVKGLQQMISDQANDEHIAAAARGENPETAPPSAFRPEPAQIELSGMPAHPDRTEDTEAIPNTVRHDASQWGTAEDADRKARTIWPIKQTAEFGGEMLLEAHDLDGVANYLVKQIPALRGLASVSIGWYWRRQGGRTQGEPRLTRMGKAEEALAHEREFDIVIKFSADHLRKMRASELYIEYLVLGVLVRIDANGPKVLPDDIWARLPGWFRYGYLGPQDRLFGSLVGKINAGHADDLTVSVEEGDADDGVQVHDDNTPLTDTEQAEQQAAEERDDPAPEDVEIVDEVVSASFADPTPIRPMAADLAGDEDES